VKRKENLRDYVIILDKRDNVGTALKDIPVGKYCLNDEGSKSVIEVRELIRAGFKVSLAELKKDEYIHKYGNVIGMAIKNINPGDKVHIENIKSLIQK